MKRNPHQPCSLSSLESCLSSMRSLRDTFRTHWTRMDAWRIALGFSITLVSLLAFLCLDLLTSGIGGGGDLNSPVLGVASIIATAVAVLLGLANLTQLAFLPLVWPLYRLGIEWVSSGVLRRVQMESAIAGGILTIVALTATSNSFVVQEARVLTYLLQTMLLLIALCSVSSSIIMLY